MAEIKCANSTIHARAIDQLSVLFFLDFVIAEKQLSVLIQQNKQFVRKMANLLLWQILLLETLGWKFWRTSKLLCFIKLPIFSNALFLFLLQNLSTVKAHARSHHTCSTCGKDFSGPSGTFRCRRHIAVCKGDPLAIRTCSKCSKVFKKPSQKRRHEKNCSPVCQKCFKKFNNMQGYRLHLCPNF